MNAWFMRENQQLVLLSCVLFLAAVLQVRQKEPGSRFLAALGSVVKLLGRASEAMRSMSFQPNLELD
jgi:hypothetical protein